MSIWKIAFIVLAIYIAISLTFQYLVTKNKLKTSKLSNLFYNDDESFIRSWEKIKEKGMLRYTIKNVIFITVMIGIIGMFFLFNKLSMYGYEQNKTLFVALTQGLILGLIFTLIEWIAGKDRHKQLKEKAYLSAKSQRVHFCVQYFFIENTNHLNLFQL